MRPALCCALLSLAGCAGGAQPPAPPHVVTADPYVLGRQPDGNSVLFEDEGGLIVVDTGRYPAHQAKILAYADERRLPVNAIVNTHWHLDHSGGNAEIRARHPQAKIYTSGAVRAALDGFLARGLAGNKAQLADPAVPDTDKAKIRNNVEAVEDRRNLLPDVEVTGPTTLGGRRLQLRLARNAATAGDVWVYDPASATLAAGDLVVLPAPFFDTGCAEGWRRALAELDAVPFRTLVPGHGAPMSKPDFRIYRAAFDRFVDCAQSDSPAGTCIDGWLSGAARFLATEGERSTARGLLDYYLGNVLRAPGKQRELCGA